MNKVLGSIAHRGPDGAGVFTDVTQPGDWQIALGHRRLAIIDVANAKQPMQDTAAGLTVVFNGEIYNFRELRQQLVELGCEFRLDSDTEVLLKGYRVWGTAIVERLRGMFAFAIWDHRNRELFLARDRFGKKPLFVHHSNGDIFFASEIKALLQIPGIASDPDNDAIRLYLIYRYVPSPRRCFARSRSFRRAIGCSGRTARLLNMNTSVRKIDVKSTSA